MDKQNILEAGAGLGPALPPEPRAPRAPERTAPEAPQIRRAADGRTEVVLPSGEVLRRNRTGVVDSFYVPPDIIPAGWSYQWNVVTVYGERQTAMQVAAMDNGWRPVPAKRHDGIFMPPGHEGAIERDGQMLMERPMVLTQEARDEERRKADGLITMQKEAIGQALPAGFDNRHRKVAPTIRTNYERSPVERPALQVADDAAV